MEAVRSEKIHGFSYGEGLYTDMNAIRRDEETDNIHSIYVDQWDWGKSSQKDHNVDTLKQVVQEVYQALKNRNTWPSSMIILEIPSENIFFITSQELEICIGLPPKAGAYKITKLRALSLC